MNVYSTVELKQLLEENGFYFKKRLGQNFLMNESIASRIAASARETIPDDVPCLALEIGPGAGALTLQLSRLFDHVLAIEIDPHLIPVLGASLEGVSNVSLECGDALRFPFRDLPERYPGYMIAICSNLPYYLTSEILMTLLESKLEIACITVLIQREAADRLIANPGSAQYGAITAAVRYYSETEILFRVGPGNFIPRPKVDSAVLRLIPRKEPLITPRSETLFFRVIHASFSARRKTILNTLSISFAGILSKEEILNVLNQSGIDPSRRGETLCLEELCTLSDNLLPWENAL